MLTLRNHGKVFAADQGAEICGLADWWVCAVSAGLNSYNCYLVFLNGKESFIEVVLKPRLLYFILLASFSEHNIHN